VKGRWIRGVTGVGKGGGNGEDALVLKHEIMPKGVGSEKCTSLLMTQVKRERG
jgi:hypothetical protein